MSISTSQQFIHRAMGGLGLAFLATAAIAADVITVRVQNTASSAQSNVPVTFGQVFKPGDVPAGAVVGGRLGSTNINLQVDKKATHRDGSLRHAVITAVIPSLAANGSQTLTLTNNGTAPGGGPIAVSALLGTTFDTSVNLNVSGTPYAASARALLQSAAPATWLSGPLATEWVLSAPLRTAAGAVHPHLQARFTVRAYQGLQAVRVDVVVENAWAREAGPRNYAYDATISVAGRGTVFSESAVQHYRQSRWRRTVWWGTTPTADVAHDGNYLSATRAVPNYDPRIQIASSRLDGFVSELNGNAKLMGIGNLQPYMPSPSGFNAIGPLPAWAAAYIISDDLRAKRVVVGYGTQAGAWPMHYREKATDQPISIDTYPSASILGGGFFPACGGTCSSPYTPEASHHPSLAYLPYLLTGDYYLMEELAFWSNWVLFYGEQSRHGGSQGLVTWDQVRGQAWSLRTLAQTAYLMPDNHPMKQYFNSKLQNNINYFVTNWVDSNPLGYITNTGAAQWLGLDDWIATWMDDFLTWTFGYIVGMGYTEAQPVFNWKAKFPVGRMTNTDMCSILAPSYWPYVRGDKYLGGSSAFVNNWRDWKRAVILSHKDDALRGTADIAGREQELINAACGSQQMASILGLGVGEMIGWFDHLSYLANMQPALAVAVDQGIPSAQAAFDKVRNSPNYAFDYDEYPQFALWPLAAAGSVPVVSLSANPATVQPGASSTLTWSASNATSCSASGGWSGNKAVSGSQSIGPLNATADFTLTCTGTSGSASASTRVTVQSASAPTLTLSANPTTVASGGSSTLTWSSTNATSCAASGGWSGTKPTSGSQSTGALTANRTYTLSCTGAGGSVQRSATVMVQTGTTPPIVTLTASPTSVNYGGSTQLSWSSTNATGCTAAGAWSGAKAVSGNQTFTNVTSNRTYTLSCTGAGGSASRSVNVTALNAPTSPVIDLNVSPTAGGPNLVATLSWTVTNGQSCTASGGWTGSRTVQGSQQTPALTQNTTYTLTCTGTGGTASESATVSVNKPLPVCPAGTTCAGPDARFSASPTAVASGGSTVLSWTSTNATGCEASGGWSGNLPANGSRTIANLRAPTTFTLTCPGYGYRARRHVTVNIGGTTPPPAPVVTLTANPTTVARGGSSVLTWSSTNATSCTASGGGSTCPKAGSPS